MPNQAEIITNAFRPGSEMDNPSLFAGREDQIGAIAKALHAVGDSPIIYGHRGLGKSSLALQAQLIATGERELLLKQSMGDWIIDESSSYVSVYVSCSDGTPNLQDILRRLVNGLLLLPQAAAAGSEEVRLVESATRLRFSAKVFGAERELRYAHGDGATSTASLDYEERLLDIVNNIAVTSGARVLLIIDELDRVADTSGLASFIKSASSSTLKVMLVGIAHNISELLSDHESLARMHVPIEVPTMTQSELELIVERAMRNLRDQGVEMWFERDATRRVSRMAQGFPWFVHLLGREALTNAFGSRRQSITVEDIDRARILLTQHRLAQQFSDMYQTAVRDSYPREVVLRAFAEWGHHDIPTADVYRVLRSRLDIKYPQPYLGHLCQETHGGIFVRPPFQKRGIVRFQNEMFKAYVRLRPSLFLNADTRVQQAWDAERREVMR